MTTAEGLAVNAAADAPREELPAAAALAAQVVPVGRQATGGAGSLVLGREVVHSPRPLGLYSWAGAPPQGDRGRFPSLG
ncbi:hypothetical protein [Streptomyces sp. NPDC000618]|uniref:hypothetical protein n=1 Tax=Streptomyces sp. NPDC000618 TaxID=3154265 RepID=UPI003332B629